MRAHCWLPSKVEVAAKASPHFEKIILAVILSRNCRLDKVEAGESGGRRLHLRVSWLRTSFNPIRILSCHSLDLLDVLLIGKGKNESTKVLRINSKIPHVWGLNCHLHLRLALGAVINRNRKSQKTEAIWKQSPKVTCQTPGAKHRKWDNLIAEGA